MSDVDDVILRQVERLHRKFDALVTWLRDTHGCKWDAPCDQCRALRDDIERADER